MSQNKTPKPHKHAELIKKWADDTSLKIEFTYNNLDWRYDVDPYWDELAKYRIKPEVIRYRLALVKPNLIVAIDNTDQEITYKNSPVFKKWLTDWVEVELDEGEN